MEAKKMFADIQRNSVELKNKRTNMEFRNRVVCKDYTEDPTEVKETVISEVNGSKFSKKEGVLR